MRDNSLNIDFHEFKNQVNKFTIKIERKMVKRHYRRTQIHLKVYSNEYNYIAKDISEGGIKILSRNNFTQRSYIPLEFYLDSQVLIKTQGKVIRNELLSNNHYEIGLQFWGLKEYNQQIIYEFIKAHLTSESAISL